MGYPRHRKSLMSHDATLSGDVLKGRAGRRSLGKDEVKPRGPHFPSAMKVMRRPHHSPLPVVVVRTSGERSSFLVGLWRSVPLLPSVLFVSAILSCVGCATWQLDDGLIYR